jgi:hypothetical protein
VARLDGLEMAAALGPNALAATAAGRVQVDEGSAWTDLQHCRTQHAMHAQETVRPEHQHMCIRLMCRLV